ncbi:MAG: phenylacetate--CoA ligase family protein [Rhodospirillaceae bacterium]|jgi:phenylacetate-CoA ligase|nr:phenylacetate--CoA ligase family protein [Rhodospirillaceae bacterium]MBT5242608.1 phenylacetate--CoA ligase family protein [Rhodospirillaceae bacterium]MBT5561361.1 phenylacetate--CoA ligase family protein [Rhodospirillaceae bacterium]MBT6242000.1 phenylacetate--CoA ligase family protein [Rhodospirillaceae bacterium]MBT7136702.1 phenylacetate--CoA ligase family protein [Rhodospirillaceae bacterium]
MTGDFMALAELKELQQQRWLEQVRYVETSSPFYQGLWRGMTPPTQLDDLAELPLSDKAMLRTSQQDHPPFGNYLAAPEHLVSRLHRTSGTSGQAMNLALSVHDASQTAMIGGRAQSAAGLGPGDRVVHCLNYQMWMGGFTDHCTLEATGAMVIPFGVGGSELLIRTIQELNITAISCTPSYPKVLEQTIAEKFPGLSPRDLGLRLGLFGGEAGLDDPAYRKRLEDTWGFGVRNANYGVSDVYCNFAAQCEHNNDLHFVALDVLYPELIDPDTSEPVDWQDGASGELVLSHLERQCQPLVRFRTGDIISLTGVSKPCVCGRTAPRFRVIGRSDDMIVVRGLNIFPTGLAATINTFKQLSGEYRVILDGPGPYDLLPLDVEVVDGVEPTPGLAENINQAIKRDLGATAHVILHKPGVLPRTEGKTRRVIRQ